MKQSREKLRNKNELCISKLNIEFSKIKSILNIIVKKQIIQRKVEMLGEMHPSILTISLS